jgi:hypothetical protein
MEVEPVRYLMHRLQTLLAVGFVLKWVGSDITTINAVSPTIMLIIFAESMVLFFSNLKSINGDCAFFSVLTNRIREINDTLENKII